MKKDYVNKIFHNIANKYDLMNDLMSFGIHRKWKEEFINYIDLKKNKNVKLLDLGCGTGDIISQINTSNKLSDYVSYLVDPNLKMIEQGQKKIKNKNNIWINSYGEKLPFKNNSFDLITMSFSLRNVTNLKKTINEINRVLKIDGQFLCLEFGKIDNLLINSIYKIYSENIIPKIGEKITGKKYAYEYLINSIKKFPSQIELKKIFKSNKFNIVNFYNLTFGLVAIYSCKKK
tara:strand:+ start:32674 stop:33369 length:696 start_codon:yes stop_codon:yes gene_type:complete